MVSSRVSPRLYQNLMQYRCSNFSVILRKLNSDGHTLHVFTRRLTANNWRYLRAWKQSRLHMNVLSTTPPKEIFRSSLVYVETFKIRYFLNTPCIIVILTLGTHLCISFWFLPPVALKVISMKHYITIKLIPCLLSQPTLIWMKIKFLFIVLLSIVQRLGPEHNL